VTGQVRFDSHVLALLEAAVGLVNGLTPGESHGRQFETPTAAAGSLLVADVLTPYGGKRPQIRHEDAVELADVAARLRDAFEGVDAGHLDAAALAVNNLLTDFGARPQLDHDPVDGWNVHFHGVDDSVVVGWTAGCATAMALAIGSDLAGRLGVCGAVRCDRVYVDTSRNGARRFCSTACQNRAKAAAFRSRSRIPEPQPQRRVTAAPS
jgi:predicted RNA-binding Zn ribbon-like protein